MTSKKKILFVFGTRPEAIKLAPVIREMEKHTDKFAPVLIATGQHREMLDQVLKPFNIKPKYDLKIMEEGQSISQVVSKTLLGLEKLIPKERPDMIIVQGDTSTAFSASLSSYYHKIPLAHVEAGLRTHDKYRPFPEELNRKLTGAITDIHFAPTIGSLQNLISEGVNKKSIHLTG
ncbi:non-hydrolyzing UDP-N-acetylglucosamine 2-epimerase, partial [Candidatus Margulisiibacteriota bacterium]